MTLFNHYLCVIGDDHCMAKSLKAIRAWAQLVKPGVVLEVGEATDGFYSLVAVFTDGQEDYSFNAVTYNEFMEKVNAVVLRYKK